MIGVIFLPVWFLVKPRPQPPLISPLPASEEENKTSISSAEEKTYQTVSYYITTSQQFLNKAQELSLQTSGGENSPRQQTPEEKQKIIELINQALDIINQGIAAYPTDDRVFAQRAAIYQALTPIFPEARKLAVQDLKEAIKLNNQNPSYYTRLAQLYLAGGDFEGAAFSFYNAYLLAPTDLQILYNLADTLEKGGELPKAAFWFEKLLGLLPAGEDQEKIRQRLTALKEAINKANLKYLSSPGQLAVPAASSKEKEIIGTQELPLEQAALASKIIIAGEKEANNAGQSSAQVSLNALSGEGTIPAGQTETIIYNNNVKATSKIVLVPLEGDFKNRVLFVAAKKASSPGNDPGSSQGWFKVGVDSPPKDEIKFKWWIVEI